MERIYLQKKIMKKLIVLTLLPFLFLNCKKSEIPVETDCDKVGIVNNEQLRNAPRDPFDFISAEIIGDCLEVAVRYGGGCGGADFQLFGQEELAQSLPPQRLVLISLDDKDNCEALVTDTISFDLTAFRAENSNEVKLTIDGISRTPILYKY